MKSSLAHTIVTVCGLLATLSAVDLRLATEYAQSKMLGL